MFDPCYLPIDYMSVEWNILLQKIARARYNSEGAGTKEVRLMSDVFGKPKRALFTRLTIQDVNISVAHCFVVKQRYVWRVCMVCDSKANTISNLLAWKFRRGNLQRCQSNIDNFGTIENCPDGSKVAWRQQIFPGGTEKEEEPKDPICIYCTGCRSIKDTLSQYPVETQETFPKYGNWFISQILRMLLREVTTHVVICSTNVILHQHDASQCLVNRNRWIGDFRLGS